MAGSDSCLRAPRRCAPPIFRRGLMTPSFHPATGVDMQSNANHDDFPSLGYSYPRLPYSAFQRIMDNWFAFVSSGSASRPRHGPAKVHLIPGFSCGLRPAGVYSPATVLGTFSCVSRAPQQLITVLSFHGRLASSEGPSRSL